MAQRRIQLSERQKLESKKGNQAGVTANGDKVGGVIVKERISVEVVVSADRICSKLFFFFVFGNSVIKRDVLSFYS